MAKRPKQFDVWFVAANTVYKQVPYNVVADWVQQGRLGAADQLRPAGAADAWTRIDQNELFADYLPRPVGAAVAAEQPAAGEVAPAPQPESLDEPETPELDPLPRRRHPEGDDDVDMIPLIDISMVLLVFFIMIRAAGSLSAVDVPDMRYAGELSSDSQAITLAIEKADETTVVYSLRVGEQPLDPDNANLPGPRVAIERLDAIASKMERPPEVRIACAQGLPSQRVYELIGDLRKLKSKGRIRGFNAEVNEAPRK